MRAAARSSGTAFPALLGITPACTWAATCEAWKATCTLADTAASVRVSSSISCSRPSRAVSDRPPRS